MKITNEETVTLTREKYDALISNLGMAIGMLRGLGVRFDREKISMGASELRGIRDDCREVADTAEMTIADLHTEELEADE